MHSGINPEVEQTLYKPIEFGKKLYKVVLCINEFFITYVNVLFFWVIFTVGFPCVH